MLDLPDRISQWLLELVRSQRAVAHLLVDREQRIADFGGDVEHYGLADIQRLRPAALQLPFLEGLLPLPESPFLLRSMEMAGGHVADVHLFAEEDATWIVLLDVTPEHGEARKTQQKAYDMTLLSQREARLRAQLQAAHEELTRAHQELAESREALLATHNRLQQELRDAERYVRAILPGPIEAPFRVESLFVPCTELGGDSFGYHWIDSEHFALYLLDVCGHGVGAALLSVAACNTLRSGALPATDFRSPEAVLDALNRAFQMEDHGDLYFTIWYGVYHPASGRLRYASAGHPAAILVNGPQTGRGEAVPLRAQGPPVGMLRTACYANAESRVAGPARLFVFSDGVYEISRPDGAMLDPSAFNEVLTRPAARGTSQLGELLRFAREVRGSDALEDDFSIIQISFGETPGGSQPFEID
jgi:serine phosphatase RsbU (regulator of sigma subunit)